ncbi:MAG: hypothetical protein FVQ81_05175 [Candidatus Glassbacteria bacterium]|nr:hypothetical protein [Candidatus Glassbacteria bacterium]
MKQKLASIGRILVLAVGLATAAVAVLVMVTSDDLAVRVTALVALAGGVIILLLAALIDRVSVFGQILRHVQYLTQSSQYTARLVHEITEVMHAIQEMEEQQQNPGKISGGGNSGGGLTEELSAEELELASTLQQFEE